MRIRKKIIKIFTATLLIVALLATGIASAAEPSKSFDTLEDRIEYMELMMKYVQSEYKYDVAEEELMEGAYDGIFDALDEHSAYFSPDEYDSFSEESAGEYEGIGVSITNRGKNTVVVTSLEGTPANKAGIKPGDVILYVDEQDVTGYHLEKVGQMLRGEPGTIVRLGIIRNNSSVPTYLDIKREVIELIEITSEVIDDSIGYIKVLKFSKGINRDFGVALNDLEDKGVAGLIVDLRNNPGGVVEEVISMADRFVKEGEPILYMDYNDDERKTYEATSRSKVDLPLVVLINKGSASASEIFAGAIKDTETGIIVGTTSFGKGTVQSVIPITNGGAVKLTIAEYLTASQKKIEDNGILPDITVDNQSTESMSAVLDFAPMIENNKPYFGNTGLNVYGAQQRLAFLGYDVYPTGVYDESTYNAIIAFQKESGLYAYGVLDWTTRYELGQKIYQVLRTGVEDLQLQTAIEKLK
jgi:carboxyl-terminal processing protease